jgi:hypothetical protein
LKKGAFVWNCENVTRPEVAGQKGLFQKAHNFVVDKIYVYCNERNKSFLFSF